MRAPCWRGNHAGSPDAVRYQPHRVRTLAGSGLLVLLALGCSDAPEETTQPSGWQPPNVIQPGHGAQDEFGVATACMEDVVEAATTPGVPLVCTANDLNLFFTIPGQGQELPLCLPGDPIASLDVEAHFAAGAKARFDVGLWIRDDNLPIPNALRGDCRHWALVPVSNAATVGTTRVAPFFDADGDTCGDLQQDIESVLPLTLQNLTCQDTNNDGLLDIGACVSYDNNSGSANACTDPHQAPVTTRPNTKSKCACGPLDIPVRIAGRIVIEKQTIPDGDAEEFAFTGTGPDGNLPGLAGNLQDGETISLNVEAGQYTATEGAETGWSLTGIACTDTDADGEDSSGDTGTRTATINVEAGETVTCVFTNTKHASLDIEKESFGGTTTFDYTVNGTGLTAFTRNTGTANPTTTDPIAFTGVQLGDKYVTESAETGFTLTDIECTLGGAVILIGTGQGAAFDDNATTGFDPGDNTVKVTVTAGDTPSCTFKNTKNPSLAIQKESVGGTETFDYTVNGTGLSAFTRNTATQGNPTTVAAIALTGFQLGDKYVTESAEAGFTLTNIVCTGNGATYLIGTGQGAAFDDNATAEFDQGDNTVKVVITAGSTPTCTFTNTKSSSLAIQKESIGGTETFDYTVDGTGLSAFTRNTATQGNPTTAAAFQFTGLELGDKYVTESAETGWTLTNIVCTANGATFLIGTGQGAAFDDNATTGYDTGDNTVKVVVAAGTTPTCTFTNTKNASLDIEKRSFGGTETFDYTVSGSGLSAFTRNTGTANPTVTDAIALTGLQLGDKYVSETAETGYTLTDINCTAGGAEIVIGTGQNGGFSQGATADFDEGDNSVKVTVSAGDTPSCTFENTKNASLDIEKESLGGTATFDYTVNGTGLSAFTRNTASANPTTTDPIAFTGFQLGDKYVTESAETGYILTNIVCTANGASYLIGTGQGAAFDDNATAEFDAGDNTVKVVVAAGSTPTCTFTNTKLGTITIVKNTVGGDGTFGFTHNVGTASDPDVASPFNISTAALTGSQVFSNVVPATYTVTETTLPQFWTFTSLSCTTGGSGAGQVATIVLPAGGNITCTFTNTFSPQTVEGRMTGGGQQVVVNAVDNSNVTVSRGFTIHCDIILSNNLEVNWKGNKWHITKPLTTAQCFDDPNVNEEPPAAGFDTFVGTGTGRLNGVDGSIITFRFIDYGEPGSLDMAEIKIYAPGGALVLNVVLTNLTRGNIQAHEDQPHSN